MPKDNDTMNADAPPGHVCSNEGLGFSAPRPRVLDPASGSRMMWFDRGHPDVVFGDRRRETLTVTDRSHGRADGTRTLTVDPDLLMDFRALPFAEGTFRLVATGGVAAPPAPYRPGEK